MNFINPFSKSFFPSKGSNKFPLISAYMELIVKSRLSASLSQSVVNSITAWRPSVLISLLKEVISNLSFSIKAVIVPCSIPVSKNFKFLFSRASFTFVGSIFVARSISSTFSLLIIFLTQPPTYLISA